MDKTEKPLRAARTDGEATRTRILDAAGELFAADGFAETTSKAIAAQAGVDLASINYHYGSRSGLYQAVLVEAHDRLASVADLTGLASTDVPAPQKLRTLIEMLVDKVTADHAWHARVLSRELLSPSSHLDVLLQGEIPGKLTPVLGILSEITGLPLGSPALLGCLISVMAPFAVFLVTSRHAVPSVQGLQLLQRDDMVAHFYVFAMGGLQAVGRDQPARPAPPVATLRPKDIA